MLTRFDGLEKELLNITDVIIKDLQIESQLLHFFLINNPFLTLAPNIV